MNMLAHCRGTVVIYRTMITHYLVWVEVNHKMERMIQGGTLIRSDVVSKGWPWLDKIFEVSDELLRYIYRRIICRELDAQSSFRLYFCLGASQNEWRSAQFRCLLCARASHHNWYIIIFNIQSIDYRLKNDVLSYRMRNCLENPAILLEPPSSLFNWLY